MIDTLFHFGNYAPVTSPARGWHKGWTISLNAEFAVGFINGNAPHAAPPNSWKIDNTGQFPRVPLGRNLFHIVKQLTQHQTAIERLKDSERRQAAQFSVQPKTCFKCKKSNSEWCVECAGGTIPKWPDAL